MSCRTVFSQIQIEAVVLFLESQLSHTGQEFVMIILPLASADDLADSRHKTVYGCHSLPVVVLLHIECLDLLRIICHKYRTFIDLFGEVPLMLCLKVASP